MRTPDITYRFMVPSDTASPTFEVYTRNRTDTQNAVGLSVGFAGVPKDRVLVLTNATMTANPGVGATVIATRMEYLNAFGLNQAFNRTAAGPPINTNVAANWNGEIYIIGQGPDIFNVTFNVTFDIAAAANTVRGHATGVVIPRGNIATF